MTTITRQVKTCQVSGEDILRHMPDFALVDFQFRLSSTAKEVAPVGFRRIIVVICDGSVVPALSLISQGTVNGGSELWMSRRKVVQ